jgi:hypothetical protein
MVPLMDVSFSAWRHSREESLKLKGDSFYFLFDRRYTNRLNRMSRVFFEAYVVATREIAAQEDRFPSLSEIDAKMESGAVYAFKDRLMKNTEFFEEVKISGVSYLVPRAMKFVDASGTYTDLILNFEEGTAVLPTRRKTPAPPEPEEEVAKPQTPPAAEVLEKEPEPAAKPPEYPAHEPIVFAEEEEPEEQPAPFTAPAPEPSPVKVAPPAYRAPSPDPVKEKKGIQPMIMALIGVAVLLAAGAIILFASVLPSGTPSLVMYSAYLSNSSNESYLGLDISNPESMLNEMEMVLPPDVDQSISARGGVVTISHASNTLVRLNSSSDASVRIYLQNNWTTIPVTLSLAVPKGFDSSLTVHTQDYLVTSKEDNLILKFNLTREGVRFEQSLTPRR